jgi:hypothetical protein
MSDDKVNVDAARTAVIGIVTARVLNDSHAAALMIDSYIQDALDDGFDITQAWAQLFSASVMVVIPLLQCQSFHHERSMTDNLGDFAMTNALGTRNG